MLFFVRRTFVMLLYGILLPIAAADAQPIPYPDKPVRIVLAFQAGSYFDTVARLLAEQLSKKFGTQFFVENKPGGNGNVGTQFVARSKPDGYTLIFVSIASHGTNPALYKSLPFDPVKDFVPISLVMRVPQVVVVRPSVPAQTLKELVAWAKENPGKINYSSAGIGTSVHMAGELMRNQAGIELYHVPYNGSPQAVQGLLSDDVQVSFPLVPSVLQQIRAGQLRALAVMSSKRSEALPDVPTTAEAGFPGTLATAWGGLMAPANTPSDIVKALEAAVQEIMRKPEIQAQFIKADAEPVGSNGEEFRTFMATELAKWRDVSAKSKISLD